MMHNTKQELGIENSVLKLAIYGNYNKTCNIIIFTLTPSPRVVGRVAGGRGLQANRLLESCCIA